MGALEIIDGAATGLGAVTGLWDSAEQTRANNANIAMQRETNQLNYKMHKEDQDFAVDMFNRTNEYNSPAEQVNRLRAAGINPSAVLGNSGSSGVVAANQPSVPAGAPMVAPRSEPAQFSPAFKMLTDGIYEHMQTRNMDLQNKQELFKILHQDQQWELDATYRLAEIDEKLAGSDLKDEERKNLKKQREVIQQELDIKREVKDDIIKRYRLDNQKVEQDTAFIREQENKQKLENAYQEMVNKAFPKLNAAQLRVLASQAAANTATAFAQTINSSIDTISRNSIQNDESVRVLQDLTRKYKL